MRRHWPRSSGVLSVVVFETDRKGGPIEVIEIRE